MTPLVLDTSALNAWICAHRAAGRWVTCCLACGWFFAQKRRGRRSIICGKQRCAAWRRIQNDTGLAPEMGPLLAKYGDELRTVEPKAHPEEQAFEWCGT